MRRLALRTAVALATVAAAVALWELRHAALLLLLSVTVAASTESALQALARRRVPRGLAIALVFAIGVVVAASTLVATLGALPREVSHALDELKRVYLVFRTSWPAQSALSRALAERLPDPSHLLDGAALGSVGSGALGLTQSAFRLGAEAAIVVMLGLLWTIRAQPFERLWLSLLPALYRPHARHLWHSLRDGVGLQLRSEMTQSLLAAVLAALWFAALGLPYPILAALSIGALRLIPFVGPLLALNVSLLCGASGGFVLSAVAFTGTLALLVGLRLGVAERLVGARRLHPLLLGVVIVVLWEGGAPYALFVGGPVAAAVTILWERLLATATDLVPGRRLSDVARRLVELERLLEHSSADRPRLASVSRRLADLAREAAIAEE